MKTKTRGMCACGAAAQFAHKRCATCHFKAIGIAKCVACQTNKPFFGAGLCASCNRNPELKNKHRLQSKFSIYGRMGHQQRKGTAPLPSTATSELPGSEEKIKILQQRASLKQSLWHPDDVRVDSIWDALES